MLLRSCVLLVMPYVVRNTLYFFMEEEDLVWSM